MKNINDYLEQLGLSKIEAKMYVTLLKSGSVSVHDLAETIEVKRTTAYLYIDQLVEKGLVVKVVKGARKMVQANEPKVSLEYLLKRKIQSAKDLENDFPTMLQSITTSHPQSPDVEDAEIKYYKGKNGVKKIYEEALKSKEIRAYVNIVEIAEFLPENYKLFDNALITNPHMNVFDICEDSMEARRRLKIAKGKHFYRLLPSPIKITSTDILIYDGKVSIIDLKGKMNGIVLYNTALFNNLKALYDYLWQKLPEPEK